MRQRWTDLTFLHWPLPPYVLEPRLPAELELDTFQGRAWISLTPFKLTVLPTVGPRIIEAPETNVRTYVRYRGRSGIWFFSLDVGSGAAAAGARLTYGLPYFWSEMRLVRTKTTVQYSCRRKWSDFGHEIKVRVGKFVERDALADLDRFLTARWRLFVKRGPVLMEAPVEHRPFEFARVEVTSLEQSLLEANALPAPEGVGHVNYTPDVEVRIGAPRPA